MKISKEFAWNQPSQREKFGTKKATNQQGDKDSDSFIIIYNPPNFFFFFFFFFLGGGGGGDLEEKALGKHYQTILTGPHWQHLQTTKQMQLKKWNLIWKGKVENILGKGKNAGYQHFLVFLPCLPKASFSRLL